MCQCLNWALSKVASDAISSTKMVMSMVQQKTEQPQHRNSLGYVISQRAFGISSEEAMIVWGTRPDGTRLFIDAARRGAAEQLKCECGAALIARKGQVRAHHFAHVAGAARGCKEAQVNAISKVGADALNRFRKVRIPQVNGKAQITPFAEARPEVFDAYGGVRIARGIGDDRRELCIVFKVKHGKTLPPSERYTKAGVSAMVVDLSQFRNLSDERIAKAIAFEAERSWLHNTRHPEAEASQANDALTQAKSSRRARKRDPTLTHLPRIEKTVTADQSQADADSGRTKPEDNTSRGKLDSLSPSELLRRLFGSEYGD